MSKEVASPPIASVQLEGELAEAFEEWRAAAADLEGRYTAWTLAKERHQIALATLRRLATAMRA